MLTITESSEPTTNNWSRIQLFYNPNMHCTGIVKSWDDYLSIISINMIDIYYITSQGKQTNEELRTLKIVHSIKTDALFTHFICECPQKWQKCTADCRYKSVATKSTYTVCRFWRHPGRWRWQWRGTTLQSSNMGAALNSTMCRLRCSYKYETFM